MSKVVTDSENRITNNYSSSHKGVDIGWRTNEDENKVYANCSGEVVEIQDNIPNDIGSTGTRSWGNYVLIKHPNGYHSRYAHLQNGIKVSKGQTVDENTLLGIMGTSGNANGRHLHFEVSTEYASTTRIDPTSYLTKAIYEKTTTDNNQTTTSNEFKIGDKVSVTGYATADSYGGGSKTATYNGDTLYVTKITDLTRPRPYHISKGNTFGNQNRGWVSKSQIKKL